MTVLVNEVFLSCFPGENVKEFFSRVAALAFERSMLKELEKSNGRMAQIGAGNLISMFSFALSICFCCLLRGVGRFLDGQILSHIC